MEDLIVVQIPGRIPHRIPKEEAEQFLKDHPEAVVAEAAEAAKPKRKTKPKAD